MFKFLTKIEYYILPSLFWLFIEQIPLVLMICNVNISYILLSIQIIVFSVYYFYSKGLRKEYNFKVDWKKCTKYTLLFFLFAIVFSNLNDWIWNLNKVPENQESIDSLTLNNPFVMGCFVVALAPFVEEYVFREKLMILFSNIENYIYDKMGLKNKNFNYNIGIGSVILTSVLFSFIHDFSNFGHFMSYATLGLGLGFIRYKSGSIKYSIITHSLWNLFVFALSLI